MTGEIGIGKSTFGHLVLGIEKTYSGSVLFNGKKLERRLSKSGIISAVFQNYKSSINPFLQFNKRLWNL
ncbi:hypothetical protein LCM30_19790 [Halobacillus litoralis]|nr:hypothetical protein [Halobacillus litoralis]